MRKNIINILLIVFALGSAKAQVAIEKDFTGNPSVLLEFNDQRQAAKTGSSSTVQVKGENKALILPVVETINSNSEDGTIWFDASEHKIKLRKEGNNIDMTPVGDTNVASPSLSEKNNETGVIIGAKTSTAPGVLVLESQDKAMVLPNVDSVTAVINPEPGAMVYDRNEKAIAVFNGEHWYFWGKYTN